MWVFKKLCDKKWKGLSVSVSTKNKIANIILILSVVKKKKGGGCNFFNEKG